MHVSVKIAYYICRWYSLSHMFKRFWLVVCYLTAANLVPTKDEPEDGKHILKVTAYSLYLLKTQ